MAPRKRMFKSSGTSSSNHEVALPKPFKKAPEDLQLFIEMLDPAHVYITHIDEHPIAEKRRIFLFPVVLNIAVVILFVLRIRNAFPFYFGLISAALGSAPADLFNPKNAEWNEIFWEGLRRSLTLLIDLALFIFVWPWPVEFLIGSKSGSPANWRWQIGFRQKEVCVRRSRDWDTGLKEIFEKDDVLSNFMIVIRAAIRPALIFRKTSYLLIDREWDLDWDLMMVATALVDQQNIDIEKFDRVVLMHHKDFGWLTAVFEKEEEEVVMLRKRQVLAFRQALTALGKENLFYRWVEMVQFEATSPGGFTPEKQEEAAKKIRDMFKAQNIDFDQLWKESTATI